MKRGILLLIGLLILVTLPVQAATPQDLGTLARYFPVDTTIFGAIRSDAAYVETLDGLLARVGEQVPMVTSAVRVSVLLEQFTNQISNDGSFDELIRPWLGDTIAAGLRFDPDDPNPEDPPLIIAVSITDVDATESFLDTYLTSEYDKIESPRGLLFSPEIMRTDPIILLTEDAVLFMTPEGERMLPAGRMATLAQSDRFSDALTALPAEDYNAMIYLEVAALFQAIQADTNEPLPPEFEAFGVTPESIEEMLQAAGPQIIGLTVLQGEALTLDLVQLYDSELITVDDVQTIDRDFAQFIPADTALMIQALDLGVSVQMMLDQLQAIGETIDQFAEGFPLDRMGSQELALVALDDAVTFLRLSVQGLTGRTFDEIVADLTGDYSLYISLSDGVPGLGLVQASAEGSGERLLTDILTLAEELNVPPLSDEMGIVIPGGNDMITELGLPAEAFDLMVLPVEGALYVGTVPAVAQDAFSPLSESEAYTMAVRFLLPESSTIGYIDFDPLVALAENLPNRSPELMLLNIFRSGTISASTADGLARLRLVLSLR